MPVQKFRSGEEMSAAPVLKVAGNPFDRFLRHCARYRMLSPVHYPHGVFKFRCIEEAQAARELIDKAARSSTGKSANPRTAK